MSNVSYDIGSYCIVKSINWSLQKNECWGVIGCNGAGKSTVFKLLMGMIEATSGSITYPSKERYVSTGYYSQDLVLQTNGNVLEEMLAAFTEVELHRREMRRLESLMCSIGVDVNLVMHQYQVAQECFEALGGFAIQSKSENILFALGFNKEELNKRVLTLSGGQKSRLMLAKAILNGRDLLLLDEPTNHLDHYSLTWLESFIKNTDATVALISHDRYFLDSVADNIIEIDSGYSCCYVGNYSTFIDKKTQKLNALSKQYQRQQTYISKTEDYIKRNIAGRNTKIARGRRTHLNKIQLIDKPLFDGCGIDLKFYNVDCSSTITLTLKNLVVGWGQEILCQSVDDIYIKYGQKIALIGLNGIGKSTLLKTINGDIEPISGNVVIGKRVKIGYFDQHHCNLDYNKTVFQQISSITPLATKEDILSFLAKFKFCSNDISKRIDILSGGERARLSVASLIRSGVNLLLLDEPTNHMDISSIESMEKAIIHFPGTVILVTHDRYLLSRTIDSILCINNGNLEFKYGTYDENKDWILNNSVASFTQCMKVSSSLNAAFNISDKMRNLRALVKIKNKNFKRLQYRLEMLEMSVSLLEKQIIVLDDEMNLIDSTNWQYINYVLNFKSEINKILLFAIKEWENIQFFLEVSNI